MSFKRLGWIIPAVLFMSVAVKADDRNDRDSKEQHHDHAIATPEPASLLLLGTGLVGLAARMRKKKAQ